MGRPQQPYLYQPVVHGAAPFNPKAHSQALNALEAAPPKPKHQGPLITFNRHPDGYDNLPYGRHVGVQEMSPFSKKSILWARKLQCAWRVLQWLTAMGVLVCVCLMRGIPETQSWILRLPPAFDVAIQTYAIWHLCHKPTRHPPSSAASYHAFALAMDIGFIPFAVFTHVLTRNQFGSIDAEGGWRTVYDDRSIDSIIFQVAMLTSLVSAGLHAVTVLIGGYLIYMFRKIANLPPDMNPLEDNLTRRTHKESKHRYKNSDMSALIDQDKRYSDISARNSDHTLTEQDPLRMSQTSEKLMGVDSRSSRVSFFQSRNGQQHAYSPHNPDTARHSWHTNASIHHDSSYQQPVSHGHPPSKSHTSFAEQDRYGASRTMSPMPASAPRIAKRFSATPTTPIPIYSEPDTADGANWESLPGADDDRSDEFDPYRYQAKQQGRQYESIPLEDDADLGFRKVDTLGEDLRDGNSSNALRMNPPTPEPISNHAPVSPLAKLSQGYNKENAHHEDERTQTMMTSTSSVYSQPETTVSSEDQHGGGKTRFYTDLAAAMRGVRQHAPATKAKSVAGSVHTHLSASTMTSSNHHTKTQPATQGDKRVRPSGTVIRKPLKSFDEKNGLQAGYTFAKASPSRVVSRSGVDLAEGDLGMGNRRREVSGKVAEEGRGGIWRRVSARMAER